MMHGAGLTRFVLMASLGLCTLASHLAQAATRYVGTCGSPNTATIAAAITAAASGDTILVCPGDYTESLVINKSNLTIQGATGDKADVRLTNSGSNITVDINPGAGLTLRHMTVTSTNHHAIYGRWSSTAYPYTFEDLSVSAKRKGIYLEVAGKVTMNNLTVTSSDEDAVWLAWGVKGAHEFDTLTLTATNGHALYVTRGGTKFNNLTLNARNYAYYGAPSSTASFTNITATSANNRALYLDWGETPPVLTFDNITATAKNQGIYIRRSAKATFSHVNVTSSDGHGVELAWDANGAHEFDTMTIHAKLYGLYSARGGTKFHNLDITSTHSVALYVFPDYDATFDGLSLHAPNHKGLLMGWSSGNRLLTISNSQITAKDRGIQIDRSAKVTMTNLTVTSTDSDAIVLNYETAGAHALSNLTVNAKDSGILMNSKTSSATIDHICVDASTYGIWVANWDTRGVNITNSKLTASTHGIRTQSDFSGSHSKTVASSNCILKPSPPRAYANSASHKFDGNYWQGVTSSTYHDGNVHDNATLSSCPVTSCYGGGSGSGGGGGGSGSTPPANFNCVEVGANADTGHLFTKLAGTAFNFDIVALKSGGGVETTYASGGNRNVAVELVDGSGTTACTSRTALVSWPSQTFTAADAGRITASAATVAGAYPNLRCRVSDGSVTGCSTDSFAIRPSAFTVTSPANADATGANPTAMPKVGAGTSFTLTATALPGYNGTPTLDAGKVQAHPGASRNGGVTGVFNAANPATGSAAGSFAYDEVGYFRFAPQGVIDTTFTAVDAAVGDCSADFSNTRTGGKYGCHFGNTTATDYFGRFIPDHFAITPGPLTQGCGSFTYFGQDFTTDFVLTAQNSSNATTYNYTGSFARMNLGNWADYGFAASGTTLSQGSSPPSGTWLNGSASVSAAHKSARGSGGVPDAPASLVVTAHPVDSDGVTMSASAVSGAAPHRFGRLRMSNAYGSELLALPVPLVAQYWNGQGFVTDTLDHCTTLPAPILTFYPETAENKLASGETGATHSTPLVSGNANLRLSAPGTGNHGYLDVDVTAPDWLKYNWDGIDQGGDGNLFDDAPRARAAFGKRSSSGKVIIRRESY